jgi:histidinol-phosphatase (PHP family)
MESFIRFAIGKKITHYGFSCHSPLPFPNNWSMNAEDLTEYRQEFFRLKQKYQTDIHLFLGLEVDYIPDITNVHDPVIHNHSWDYLISSIHHLGQLSNGEHWNIDGDLATFKKGLDDIFKGDIVKASEIFYRYTGEMIEAGGFDIIGHMDKIALNGRYFNTFDSESKWYNKQIMEIFQLISEKGIIVEINTKSFYNKHIVFPDIRYMKQMKQLNIPVMINSDCHYPDKLTDGFREIYDILKETGYETVRILTEEGWKDVPVSQISCCEL